MAKVDDDLAAMKAERDQLKAERAQLIADARAAEKAQREAESKANDTARQMLALHQEGERLKAEAEQHQQRVYARDWQLEQQRERARRALTMMTEIIQPVQTAVPGFDPGILPIQAYPGSHLGGVPVDRGQMTKEEADALREARDAGADRP